MSKTEPVLVHLHPDFQSPLEELLDLWNGAQRSWNFVGLRPRRGPEKALLTPGSISDDQASAVADDIRTSAGYASINGILVFTEKRLYDDDYDQLFVGGREADEEPPRVGVLSLDFLRKAYGERRGAPILFRAVVSNILFSIGIDSGLEDHGSDTLGCIMDFCAYMPDIETGLTNGPQFCPLCVRVLEKGCRGDLIRLADVARGQPRISATDAIVSESIMLRGIRYARNEWKFDYDIALSFAGADRRHAERLATLLRAAGLQVFYDQFDQATLWGKNLHAYLTELYRLRAKFCVVFLSANYADNRWTRVELDAALAREFELGKEYVLPLRLDHSDIAGILPTRGYLDWHEHSAEAIVAMIKNKLES